VETQTEAGDSWQLIAVRFGTRTAHKSRVYLNHQIYKEPDAEIEMDYFFWVARNGARTVLIDTGFNEASGAKRGRTLLIEPANALAAIGVDVDSIDTTVITHMHYDHAGNLGLAPRSHILLARREYEFWSSPMGRRALFASAVETDDIVEAGALIDEGRLTLTDGDVEVAPGITVLEVGGHTAGQTIVVVRTDAGDVILASDAVHYYEELELDRPFVELDDLQDVFTVFDRVNGMLAHGAILIPGHDPDVMRRCRPLPGAPAGLAVVVGEREGATR